MMRKTSAGFDVADFRSRWIQFFQNAGFWPLPSRMSSWCSFRCPRLDELGSKSDVNILYRFCRFCCKMCVFYGFQTVRLVDDCFWSGGFFGVVIWFMTKWWCLLLISKTFAGFNVADLRSRWIQSIFPNCRLLAFPGRMSSSWPPPGQNVFLVFIQMYVPR